MSSYVNLFGITDYAVFAGMLLISGAIGVFFAIKGQKNAEDALMGGKSMGIIPVAASIMATFLSAVGLLGVPAEVYVFGTQMMFGYTFIVMPLLTVITAYLIVPVFYNLGTPSANEYLEKRFGKVIRVISCILYIGTMVFYMGVSLFAPAMALAQMTGLAAWITIWTTGLVCTFYTAFGGLKAVVWSDAFQSFVMFIAMIWIVVKGIMDSGGIKQVWLDNYETDRIIITDFDPSPYVRVSFWSCIIGGTVAMVGAYGTNQATIQRYLALPTLQDAQKTVWSALPMFTIVNLLCTAISMVIVSRYRDCDPMKTKRVHTADQLFALFIMDTMGTIPGIPGIFMAGIFSASLSTISSGINSVSAVLLEDIIRPYIAKKLSDTSAVRVIRYLSLVFGILCMLTATVAGKMGNIIQASMFVFGLLGAPMFGTFILGLFIPWASKLGALVGLFAGFCFNIWMGMGSLFNFPYHPMKEKNYVDGCPELYFNVTGEYFSMEKHRNITAMQMQRTAEIFPIFRISFMYYMLIGVVVVVGVGTLFSFITGAQDIHKLDTNLLVPFIKGAVEKKQRQKKRQEQQFVKDEPEIVYMLKNNNENENNGMTKKLDY